MQEYIEVIKYKNFFECEECKKIIEEANPNIEQDFNEILKSIPNTYVVPFLNWIVTKGREDIIIERVDDIVQYISNINEKRNYWIVDTIEFLTKIENKKIEEVLDNNIISIIEKNFEGSFQKAFITCNKCKYVEKLRQTIEENYERIIKTAFQKNVVACKDDRIIYALKYLIKELAERENIRFM